MFLLPETQAEQAWRARASRTGHRRPAASFDGRRVLTLESRRAPELALLIVNYGGVPVVAPSLREVPLESQSEAIDFARGLEAGEFGCVIFLTGVGARTLLNAIGPHHPRESFLAALSRTRVVARVPVTEPETKT